MSFLLKIFFQNLIVASKSVKLQIFVWINKKIINKDFKKKLIKVPSPGELDTENPIRQKSMKTIIIFLINFLWDFVNTFLTLGLSWIIKFKIGWNSKTPIIIFVELLLLSKEFTILLIKSETVITGFELFLLDWISSFVLFVVEQSFIKYAESL